MNIQDYVDTDVDYEIMDDLPISEHVEWRLDDASGDYLEELDFDAEQDDYIGAEGLDFEAE